MIRLKITLVIVSYIFICNCDDNADDSDGYDDNDDNYWNYDDDDDDKNCDDDGDDEMVRSYARRIVSAGNQNVGCQTPGTPWCAL